MRYMVLIISLLLVGCERSAAPTTYTVDRFQSEEKEVEKEVEVETSVIDEYRLGVPWRTRVHFFELSEEGIRCVYLYHRTSGHDGVLECDWKNELRD